jgi:chemotaxis family two-component system sensor kinase Cph1
MADEMQVIQLFQSLIGNAIKYRTEETPRVHLIAVINGEGKWLFTVEHNGIGFDSQYSDEIFGMFQHPRNRDEFAGIG